MIRVTRRYRFSASHRLHAAALPDALNREIYGKCNNPYGHGHDYVLEVSARGPVEASGRAVNLERLDALVRRHVLAAIDHRNLSSEVPEFETRVPTTENLAVVIRQRLQARWREAFPGDWPQLDGLRIEETRRNYFELR
jgi:6-pyruvoyltetrahydropterin/6-carboxytetrahydropterin synthase